MRLPNAVVIVAAALALSMVFAGVGLAGWQDNGTPACTTPAIAWDPDVASDGRGGALISWTHAVDDFPPHTDVYVQRINAHGNLVWDPGGVPACQAEDYQTDTRICSDGNGGAYVVWSDRRADSLGYDVYAQRVSASGEVCWAAGGIKLSDRPAPKYYAGVVPDGVGGAFFAWNDYGESAAGIYAQHVDSLGNLIWGLGGLLVAGIDSSHGWVKMATDANGGFYLAWHDDRNGNLDIFAAHVHSFGTVEGDSNGTPVCTEASSQYIETIICDGVEPMIAWTDHRSGSNSDIYVQKLHQDLSSWWEDDGIPVCTEAGGQWDVDMVSDGAYGALLVWTDGRSEDCDIYAQHVNYRAACMWTDGVERVCAVAGDQRAPRAAADGEGGFICIWEDDRDTCSTDIYAQHVLSDGTPAWGADGVRICDAPRDQRLPVICTDMCGGAIMAWYDMRDAVTSNIYVQRMEHYGYWGTPAPLVYRLRDVPGDQGGCLSLAWYASRLDTWPEASITQYTLWRAIDHTLAATLRDGGAVLLGSPGEVSAGIGDEPTLLAATGGVYFWELVETVDAYHLGAYSRTVPTLFDSTSVTWDYHYYQVIAHTADPMVFWASGPDSARSVDNLAPGMPLGLAGEYGEFYGADGVLLTWDPNVEPDLRDYAVYGGYTEDFVPDAYNRLGEPSDTFFVDYAFEPNKYYKVSARDVHENESGHALLRPESVSGLGPGVPPKTALRQNTPNPFASETQIEYAVQAETRVQIKVYDVSGRRVRTLEDRMIPAGFYKATWDGRDDRGEVVAPGIYVYRMDTPGFTATRKLVLMK